MSPLKGIPSSEVTELFCLVPSKFFTSRLSIFNQFTSGGYKYGYKFLYFPVIMFYLYVIILSNIQVKK